MALNAAGGDIENILFSVVFLGFRTVMAVVARPGRCIVVVAPGADAACVFVIDREGMTADADIAP